MPDYVAVPHVAYNWIIAAYFFLGGLGAGAFLLSVFAAHWKQEFKPVAKLASVIAPAAIAVGLLFLLVDLGQPTRAWRLFTTFKVTSAVCWGVWFLNIFFVLSVVHSWLLFKEKLAKAKSVARITVPFALLVGVYTGVLLTHAPGRVMWHSALTPVFFVTGGLISGMAVVILLSVGSQSSEMLSKLGKIVAWLVLLELGFVAIELITLSSGSAHDAGAVKALLAGTFSLPFLGIQIVLGSLIPLVILLRKKVNSPGLALASLLVLIGVFTMRYIIVIGGQTI